MIACALSHLAVWETIAFGDGRASLVFEDDVQLLAGHRSIETTERYIDDDTCAQRKLVGFV